MNERAELDTLVKFVSQKDAMAVLMVLYNQGVIDIDVEVYDDDGETLLETRRFVDGPGSKGTQLKLVAIRKRDEGQNAKSSAVAPWVFPAEPDLITRHN